ncbi:ATP-binding protein [Streptomyces sp. 4F14]|uniref:ATP-binding protein n=1 Tax=Streptomyces sp. 4F14 TaxID=3394380 RepID=UPI003A897779
MPTLRTSLGTAPNPPDHPTYAQTLPCTPETAETSRVLVPDLVDRAVLVVTELIANAVRHTACREIRLVVGRPYETGVRIGVVDGEPTRLPVPGRTGGEDESGRGLLLVDAVADRWRYDLHLLGGPVRTKEVWAELRVGAGG